MLFVLQACRVFESDCFIQCLNNPYRVHRALLVRMVLSISQRLFLLSTKATVFARRLPLVSPATAWARPLRGFTHSIDVHALVSIAKPRVWCERAGNGALAGH